MESVESAVRTILALDGFEWDFKKENPTGQSGFPVEYPGRELNPYNL